MKLDKIFQALTPKEKKFFPMLKNSVDNLVHCSELFMQLICISEIDARIPVIEKIKEAEKNGDDNIKLILNELNSTFIVPFDREDIFNLINTIDDVIDCIDGTSQRISYLHPKDFPEEISDISERLTLSCKEIKAAVYSLENLNYSDKIKENCKQVKRIEKETDELFRKSMINLMKTETDPVEFIKKKEILEVLEDCIDLCEDVTDIIRGVIIKFG